MAHAFEYVKASVAGCTSFVAEKLCSSSTIYLATGPVEEDARIEQLLRNRLGELEAGQKNQVYGKVWELAKMQDPRIDGARWGQEHAFDNTERLAKALHRLGLLGTNNLHSLQCLPFEFGEGGIGSQYFSLGEKLGRDPKTGHIGYVNGMGMPSLGHAGRDAACFSERFADGNNIHCVYHSTHQKATSGDLYGYWADVLRMQAVNGGSYTKTSYLIAQQWVDFLDANPDRKYLQVGVSEGAAHVNGALRLIQEARPELLTRIRVLNLCPAYFILPQDYKDQVQAINLVKREDGVINPWGTNTDKIGSSEFIHMVPHHATNDHPHNQLSDDFRDAAKPYIDEFMRSGNIY